MKDVWNAGRAESAARTSILTGVSQQADMVSAIDSVEPMTGDYLVPFGLDRILRGLPIGPSAFKGVYVLIALRDKFQRHTGAGCFL